MKENVLQLLMQAKDFISGEEMSRILGVSRTAIWKHINKLKEEGYTITSITNKGYKLSFIPDQFNAHELQNLLKECKLIDEYYTYDTIDSTNKQAKRVAAEHPVTSALFISEEQTLGIGRRGRAWVSNAGTGIYMSMLLRPSIKPVNAPMLTLIAGLAVCTAITELTHLKCQIKWPNDIVLNSKKICGILTEMSSEMDYINYVIIGIGINVNNETFDETIEQVATSLKLVGGEIYSRKDIAVGIVQEFEKLYDIFLKEESLRFILDAYNQACVNVGKLVKVEVKGEILIGQSLRVTEQGDLVVKKEDGEELIIHSGEVSVRGLYGYVD